MHGGLSPELTNLDQIHRIMRPIEVPDTGLILSEKIKIYLFFKESSVIYFGLTQKQKFRGGLVKYLTNYFRCFL